MCTVERLSIILSLLFAASTVTAQVYRCTGPAGEPLFSQIPCATAGDPLVIRGSQSGFAPAGVRTTEREWLAKSARERIKAVPGETRQWGAAKLETRKDRAHACTRRQQALDEVNARLRRGYKPAQGERLRQRRQGHEDYIEAFCRR